MAADRMQVLKSMVAQDPKNTFARYGLAMELIKAGKPEEGVEEFRSLLADSPDYAAGYFHAGRALENMGRLDDAREMYEQGIAVTTRTGDTHTRSELQAALDVLGL
jgi:tetratricopeptide (TPR) repeat protein